MRLNTLEETERTDMRNKTVLLTVILLVILGMLLTACGSKAKATATQPAAPGPTKAPVNQPTVVPTSGSGNGEALLKDRCTKCHSLDRVTSAKKSSADWETTVARMVGKGAKLTSDEQKVLVEYLAKTYAP
jgi:cytochrome c5